MDNRIMYNQPIRPLEKTRKPENPGGQDNRNVQGADFKKLLQEQLDKTNRVQFSKHAQNRISSRKINLSKNGLEKLTNGMEKAADKGARDSLIMVDGVAYVVSVENNTVITAIDNDSIKENVFTNIDSAVFM